MIGEPLNDTACLSKYTDVAKRATERSEVQTLADSFLARNNHDTDNALEAMRQWLRNKPQTNDTGHGPEPRVDCGTVQQRVDYLGENPNCSERTILYSALGELIDPNGLRQMATIKTPYGLHTFPLENGNPVVLDPTLPRNALLFGLHAMRSTRNGGCTANTLTPDETMTPHEMVEFTLDIADEPARHYRNGTERVTSTERSLRRLWNGQPIAQNPHDFRNALSDIAWTFALAEQAARVSGGHGLDAVRLSSMAVQSLLANRAYAQARNFSFSIGGRKISVNLKKATRSLTKHLGGAASEVLTTAEKVAKSAGPLAGPAIKTYLISHGIPPQAVDAVAGKVLKGVNLSPGPLGFKTPLKGTLNALAFDSAVKQIANTVTPKKG